MKLNLLAIGCKLRFYRRENKMSITDVASFLDINPENIYRWESGRHQPGMLSLYRLAKLYGAHMEDLIVLEDDTEI